MQLLGCRAECSACCKYIINEQNVLAVNEPWFDWPICRLQLRQALGARVPHLPLLAAPGKQGSNRAADLACQGTGNLPALVVAAGAHAGCGSGYPGNKQRPTTNNGGFWQWRWQLQSRGHSQRNTFGSGTGTPKLHAPH
jgi:hypothetical protein